MVSDFISFFLGFALGWLLMVGLSVKLENCIVCQRATIEDRADLRDCEVGGQFEVVADRESSSLSLFRAFLFSNSEDLQDRSLTFLLLFSKL